MAGEPLYESPEQRTWPAERRAAAQCGVSPFTFRRCAADLGLEGVRGKDGCIRYDPKHVESIAAALNDEKTRDVAEAPEAQALRAANEHAERMFRIFEEPARQVLEVLRDENRDLRLEVKELRAQHNESVRLREQLLSEQTARDIVLRESEKDEERKAAIWKTLTEHAPKLLAALDVTVGKSRLDAKRTKAAVELLGDFQPAQLQVLLGSDFVSEKQKGLLRTVLGIDAEQQSAVEPAAPAAAPPEPPSE